jgi:chaperonin GroEL
LASAITTDGSDSVAAGKQILKSSLDQPFRILLSNAGINADEWLPQVKSGKPGYGVDVNRPAKLADLKTAGVVDPARVIKEALQNAVSIAGTAMTMGALVVDVPEKSQPMAGGAGMGGMDMGM